MVRMCDLGKALKPGEAPEGAGVGLGWGLRGSSMSSCLLVWLVGRALGPDFAPVGGVLASKAPPAHTSQKWQVCMRWSVAVKSEHMEAASCDQLPLADRGSLGVRM